MSEKTFLTLAEALAMTIPQRLCVAITQTAFQDQICEFFKTISDDLTIEQKSRITQLYKRCKTIRSRKSKNIDHNEY